MLHQTQGVLYMLPVECSRQPCLGRGLGEGERVGNNNQEGRRGMPGCTLPLENGEGRTGMSLLLFSPLGLSGYGCMPSFVLDPEGQYPSSCPHPIVAPISLLLSEEHFLLCRPDVPSFSSKNVAME